MLAIACAVFTAAAAVAAWLIRPFAAGQVGFDSAASVIYFDRLTAGRQLESFVTATPKPLLTLVYGALHALTGDWRPLSWATIAAFATAVVLATMLAWRLGGPLAAAFAAVAFGGSSRLLADVALAYAEPWALVGWLAAGLALVADRPRYGIAGVALMLAGLARFETVLVSGLAALVLVWLELRARRGAPRVIPRRAFLVLIGLGTVPIQTLHDVLLTGNPFYSTFVASATAPNFTPYGVLRLMTARYLGMLPLVLLAVIGAVILIRDRRWPIVAGLTALGPGVAAFLVFLAVRGTYVSDRYLLPIDLVLAFAASIGFTGLRLVNLGLRWPAADRRPRLRQAGLVLVAMVMAIATVPMAPMSRSLVSSVRATLQQHIHADRAVPVLNAALDREPGLRASIAAEVASGRQVKLLVSGLLRPQMVVDLHLPLYAVGGLDPARIDASGSYLSPGQLIFYDRAVGRTTEGARQLELSQPASIGAIHLVPLLADPADGFWVLKVESTH